MIDFDRVDMHTFGWAARCFRRVKKGKLLLFYITVASFNYRRAQISQIFQKPRILELIKYILAIALSYDRQAFINIVFSREHVVLLVLEGYLQPIVFHRQRVSAF